ncbi:MAG: lipoate--protein ligase family protein [Acidobacteriota bacterium]
MTPVRPTASSEVAWEFRADGAADGPTNMAMDEELLRQAAASPVPAVFVRVYRWAPPTASVGFHQQLERALDLAACRRLGVPVVRRPTGGRAVFHDDELTYAVAANARELFGSSVPATYRRLAGILAEAFARLGVPVTLAARSPALSPRSPAATSVAPCFTAPARDELLVRGRKLVGSAQCRRGGAFLQHGSIPLRIDYARMAEVLGVSEEVLRRAMISLEEAAATRVREEDLVQALRDAFATRLRK